MKLVINGKMNNITLQEEKMFICVLKDCQWSSFMYEGRLEDDFLAEAFSTLKEGSIDSDLHKAMKRVIKTISKQEDSTQHFRDLIERMALSKNTKIIARLNNYSITDLS